jgi:hypothetical protein
LQSVPHAFPQALSQKCVCQGASVKAALLTSPLPPCSIPATNAAKGGLQEEGDRGREVLVRDIVGHRSTPAPVSAPPHPGPIDRKRTNNLKPKFRPSKPKQQRHVGGLFDKYRVRRWIQTFGWQTSWDYGIWIWRGCLQKDNRRRGEGTIHSDSRLLMCGPFSINIHTSH